MIATRLADQRGSVDLGWLDSRHSFSFGHYYDAEHVGFGPLRVINEDRIRPGAGFDTHGHRDMEIITYVIAGALEHRDSTGGGSVIGPGIVQRMTAGTGIRHSEYNASGSDPVHLLQIWIEPRESGFAPDYAERRFDLEAERGTLRLLVSADGRDGSLIIQQDADLYAARLDAGDRLTHATDPRRKLWVQVVAGTLRFNGTLASAGDGLAISGEAELSMTAERDAEFLLFDMAAG
ncbi:MAG: pirin family protein [Alphaproteobacteria bacterium]|nr:pirin family protein [Alphaproteobacteria bacterium]